MGLAKVVVLLALFAFSAGVLGAKDAKLLELHAAKANPKPVFLEWVEQTGKAYLNNVQELEKRFAIWLDNLEFALAHNANSNSRIWLSVDGPFADLTRDEYRKFALGYDPSLRDAQLTQEVTPFRYANATAPTSIDWRTKGAVTPPKNQMQCGSCWAFSTTGAIEGINAIVTGDLVSVSEQELVDCDTTRDHGCHGGLMDFAYTFVIKNGGLDTEKDYPYKAVQGVCQEDKKNRHVVTIDSYEDVPPNDEDSLLKAVAHQPVAVAIEADQREFQLYAGGVFDQPCGTALDHGVLAVGYGVEKDVPYWIVKNSWGAMWGDKGYIRLQRGVGVTGQCGIAMQPSYPVKTGPNPPVPPPGPSPKPPSPGPKPPKPSQCDQYTQCPAGSTCCCLREFFGYCFTWACCPLPQATCCDDHQHCCPENLPVCDTAAGRCLQKEGSYENSLPWYTKTPAERIPLTTAVNRFIDGISSKFQQRSSQDESSSDVTIA